MSSTRSMMDKVAEFHTAFGVPMHQEPVEILPARALLRVQLISEEIAELVHALAKFDRVELLDALCDLQYVINGTYWEFGLVGLAEVEERAFRNASVTEIGKGPHLLVVGELLNSTHLLAKALHIGSAGLAVNCLAGLTLLVEEISLHIGVFSHGLFLAAFREVHRSNMRKLVNGAPLLDEAGRVQKPSTWSPPRLEALIRRYEATTPSC